MSESVLAISFKPGRPSTSTFAFSYFQFFPLLGWGAGAVNYSPANDCNFWDLWRPLVRQTSHLPWLTFLHLHCHQQFSTPAPSENPKRALWVTANSPPHQTPKDSAPFTFRFNFLIMSRRAINDAIMAPPTPPCNRSLPPDSRHICFTWQELTKKAKTCQRWTSVDQPLTRFGLVWFSYSRQKLTDNGSMGQHGTTHTSYNCDIC